MKTRSIALWSAPFALLLATACGGSSSEPETAATAQASSTSGADAAAPAAPAHPPAVNAGQPISNPMFDDLEDGNNKIVEADGRGGYWYTYKDPGDTTIEPVDGTDFTPTAGGADGSGYAARFSGTIGTAEQYPYAGMGFTFLDPKQAYDLSKCDGIMFKAKKGSPEADGMLRMKVGDVNTVPEGGVCQDCFNDFGRDVLLSEEWAEIKAPFYEMKQEPYWGEPKPKIVATHTYQIQFQVKNPGPYDVWIDDVQAYGCKD